MRELPFVDNSALVAHSAEDRQKIVDAFCDASNKFGHGNPTFTCASYEYYRRYRQIKVIYYPFFEDFTIVLVYHHDLCTNQ